MTAVEARVLRKRGGAHEGFARFLGIAGGADGFDDGIEILKRLLETEQDVLAIAGFAEQELGAPADDFDAVVDEALDAVDQPHFARLAVDDRQHDDAEVDLHLRQLVQVVENDFGLLAALEFDHHAQTVAIAFVADVADAVDLLVVNQRGDLLDQRALFTW
jgi:hypothetical protein